MCHEQLYSRILNPKNFIKQFEDLREFGEWLVLGSVKDLECTLQAFEEAELYEECNIISKVLEKVKELESE